MKVAFTTQDLVHINAQLGWASHIVVYEVSAQGYRWLETFEFPSYEFPTYSLSQGRYDVHLATRLATRIAAIADCALVYVADIREHTAGRLLQHQITPIQAISESETITEVLDRLRMVLQGTPPPWLHKALQRGHRQTAPLETYWLDRELSA